MKSFVNRRNRTAIVENDMHKVRTSITAWSRFGGSTKLGMTPGGGAIAGPFSLACSAVAEVIPNILIVRSRVQVENEEKGRIDRRGSHLETRFLNVEREVYKEQAETKKFETRIGDENWKEESGICSLSFCKTYFSTSLTCQLRHINILIMIGGLSPEMNNGRPIFLSTSPSEVRRHGIYAWNMAWNVKWSAIIGIKKK